MPTDIGIEAQHAQVTVTDPRGRSRLMPSFVIRTDHVTIGDLDQGKGLKASTRVFWSSRGFAFPEPGKYEIAVRIVWTDGGVPLGCPDDDRRLRRLPADGGRQRSGCGAARIHEVGMYVALGGDAPHLTEAVARLDRVAAMGGEGDQAGAKALRGYADIMPGAEPGATPAGDLAARAKTRAKKRPARAKAKV